MSSINERDKTLSVLDSNLAQLSKLYKKCFMAMGRGALLVNASHIIEGRLPNKHDYRNTEEILEVFDTPASHDKLKTIILLVWRRNG